MYPSRIRLSTSNLDVLLRCDREFQIDELLVGGQPAESTSAIFTFGHSWGEGIMEYLVTQDLDAAIYHAWRSYWPHLEDESSGRLEEYCFHALKNAKEKLDMILRDWKVATFNGKPARELGFHLDINERFYFQSMMDGVLEHRREGHFAVLENKHTMSWLEDITPLYKNAFQALMYSVVLDKIANQLLGAYNLHYFVGQFVLKEFPKVRIHHFPWRKTILDRLNLFLSLGMDVQRLQMMLDMNLFPMRGKSCLRYNRTCPHFGTCQLRSNDIPKTDEYVEKNKTAHVREVEASIQFRFKLDEIVADHLRLVQETLK